MKCNSLEKAPGLQDILEEMKTSSSYTGIFPSRLMKIAIEGPELKEVNFNEVLDIFKQV